MTEREVAESIKNTIEGTSKAYIDVTDHLDEVLYINVNGEDFKLTVERRF